MSDCRMGCAVNVKQTKMVVLLIKIKHVVCGLCYRYIYIHIYIFWGFFYNDQGCFCDLMMMMIQFVVGLC